MTTATFKYIDPRSYDPSATAPFQKPWNKVDGPGKSYSLIDCERRVHDLRGREDEFTVDLSGFAVYHAPSEEKSFMDERRIQDVYYPEVEALVKERLHGVRKVVIFDHTIRRRSKTSLRQPVQLVHIDQSPGAAEARARRHVPEKEVERLLEGRYQIVNLWRPIENPAYDHPLAVIDGRSMEVSDFVKVDLLYPKVDEHGTAISSDPSSHSHDGYEVKGEQYAIAPSEKHQFYYMKGMTPDEVMLIKCFDSSSHQMTGGKTDIAHGSGHTAFDDPATPADAPARQSIEVRCLVFYD